MTTPLQGQSLLDGLRVVLNAINQMFCWYFWTTRLRQAFETDTELREVLRGIDNAIVDSTLINARQFDDFCRGKRRCSDDLCPSDFPGLSLRGAFLGPERTDIDKQIAHLTTDSLARMSHPLPYKNILAAALPRMKDFCGYAKTVRMDDRQMISFVEETARILEHVDKSYINAEPAAAPNGGPTTQQGNSGVSEGPPSVS